MKNYKDGFINEIIDYSYYLKNMGIIRFDYGHLEILENDSNWESDACYVIPEDNNIHEYISKGFIDAGFREPIKYLLDFFKENPIVFLEGLKGNDIIGKAKYFTFEVNLENSLERNSPLESNLYLRQNEKRELDPQIRESILTEIQCHIESYKRDSIDLHSQIRNETSALKKFKLLQQVFADYVANKYNSVLGKNLVTHVTIFLFGFFEENKNIDFSNFAAVFSNGDLFLKNKTKENLSFNIVLQLILQRKYSNLTVKLKDDSIRSAIKSAKAAIMSRNMSHNLGSHVMAYLKQNLTSIQEMLSSGILRGILPKWEEEVKGEEDLKKLLIKSTEKMEKDELPFLVGLGKFISYLQERQDFIATIATDFIPYYSTVNFKDFIYDELNPDLRHKRHENDRSGCQPDNILLNNIARSEGLMRKPSFSDDESRSDIVIRFRNFDGNNQVENPEAAIDLDDMRKYDFSMPGGVVGRQAIFSIVENVIRNAAKHGNWKEKGKLELAFDIYDIKDQENLNPEDELSAFLNKYYFDSSVTDINDLYVITLTDNLNITDENLASLKNAVREYYVDNNGVLKNSNKGLKEMRISAAWLRGLSDMEKKDENLSPLIYEKDQNGIVRSRKLAPILNVRICQDEEGKHLQYIFCVQKTKNIAILCPENECKLDKNWLIQNGWALLTEKEYLSIPNKSYELIIVPDDVMKQRIQPYSPNRVMVNYEIYETIKNKENDLKKTYLNLLKDFFGVFPEDKITISDDKRSDLSGIFADGVIYGSGLELNTKYVYRKHHETYEEFVKFMQDYSGDEGFTFVEGISGHNSTDRLVRNEILDEKWFYKQIHIMNTKVAVFDERLFTKMTKIDEAELEIKDKLLELFELNQDIDLLKESITTIGISYLKSLVDESEFNDFCSNIIDIDNKESLKETLKLNEEFILSRSHLSIVNAQKNTYFFTVIFNEKEKQFDIWGYNGFKMQKGKYVGVLNKIAKIIMTEFGPKIEISDNYTYKNQFDYISIHQGLLDKIYDKFGFKYTKDDLGNIDHTYKFVTTAELSKEFLKNEKNSEKESNKYIPELIIHSGRSKPSRADLPQMQPFIQYAAIEHAVLDCKYSLVELLDYARYEPE